MSQNSSSNHVLRTTLPETTKSINPHEESKMNNHNVTVHEVTESAEIETQKDMRVFGNITVVPNNHENPQSVNNSIVVS